MVDVAGKPKAIKGEAAALWRLSLYQWLRGGLSFEALFEVDSVTVWNGQLTESVVVDGLIHRGKKLVPGVTPLKMKAGARIVVREVKGRDTVEVEFLGHADTIWLVMRRDNFDVLRRSVRDEDLRAGHRNPVCREGLSRYDMFARARPPFL